MQFEHGVEAVRAVDDDRGVVAPVEPDEICGKARLVAEGEGLARLTVRPDHGHRVANLD